MLFLASRRPAVLRGGEPGRPSNAPAQPASSSRCAFDATVSLAGVLCIGRAGNASDPPNGLVPNARTPPLQPSARSAAFSAISRTQSCSPPGEGRYHDPGGTSLSDWSRADRSCAALELRFQSMSTDMARPRNVHHFSAQSSARALAMRTHIQRRSSQRARSSTRGSRSASRLHTPA